jgi:hypothetical protein
MLTPATPKCGGDNSQAHNPFRHIYASKVLHCCAGLCLRVQVNEAGGIKKFLFNYAMARKLFFLRKGYNQDKVWVGPFLGGVCVDTVIARQGYAGGDQLQARITRRVCVCVCQHSDRIADHQAQCVEGGGRGVPLYQPNHHSLKAPPFTIRQFIPCQRAGALPCVHCAGGSF